MTQRAPSVAFRLSTGLRPPLIRAAPARSRLSSSVAEVAVSLAVESVPVVHTLPRPLAAAELTAAQALVTAVGHHGVRVPGGATLGRSDAADPRCAGCHSG